MPEFILQEFKHPVGRPPQKIIIPKNEYCSRVKMPEWDRLKEAEPKDNDPYDPPFGNQNLSTYNRLGHMTEDKNHFVSETRSFLENINEKDKHTMKSDKRPMIHFLTRPGPCGLTEPRICPIGPHCAPDYMTTMQDSYKMPYPGVLHKLTARKLPHLQTRRLKWEGELTDTCKFLDDARIPKLSTLQCAKKVYHRSYDPVTNLYTDGSPPTEKVRKCITIPKLFVYECKRKHCSA